MANPVKRSRHSLPASRTWFFALVAYVAGICCEEVAFGLLIGRRWWFCREDFLAECVRVGVIEVDVFACVGWMAAVAALKAGCLGCSCSERHVPRLAGSGAAAALVGNVIPHAARYRRYVLRVDVGTAR